MDDGFHPRSDSQARWVRPRLTLLRCQLRAVPACVHQYRSLLNARLEAFFPSVGLEPQRGVPATHVTPTRDRMPDHACGNREP